MNDAARIEQRAMDPLSRLMVRRLIVPKVYFEARWPDEESRVDLLVIDRAGVGDVHVIEVKRSARAALSSLARLMQVPAHYRWLAFPAGAIDPESERKILERAILYPEQGPGRVGLIEIVEMANDELAANVILTAERFAGSYYDEADKFTASNKADLEFR